MSLRGYARSGAKHERREPLGDLGLDRDDECRRCQVCGEVRQVEHGHLEPSRAVLVDHSDGVVTEGPDALGPELDQAGRAAPVDHLASAVQCDVLGRLRVEQDDVDLMARKHVVECPPGDGDGLTLVRQSRDAVVSGVVLALRQRERPGLAPCCCCHDLYLRSGGALHVVP